MCSILYYNFTRRLVIKGRKLTALFDKSAFTASTHFKTKIITYIPPCKVAVVNYNIRTLLLTATIILLPYYVAFAQLNLKSGNDQ